MKFELTVLGSSSAIPTTKRYPTAHVLNVHERFFLFDCGEGTQMQLRRFKIRFGKINHIFISHLHGDHYFGLFGLLATFNLLGRENELNIYSPYGLEELVMSQFAPGDFELKYPVVFNRIPSANNAVIYEDDDVEVRSFKLKHRVTTHGFIVREKEMERNIIKSAISMYKISITEIVRIKRGEDLIREDEKIPNSELTENRSPLRSYAYCTDTLYSEKIIPYIKEVTLLYHEATFTEDLIDRAVETHHSTAKQAAEMALKANAGKLLIGHFSARYKETDLLLKEASEVFSEVIIAEDGLTISL